MTDKIAKSEEDWKQILSTEQYHILREKGTEKPFSGKYTTHKKNGVYVCTGCGNPLFSSETKFDSGSGWPSFYDIIKEGNVKFKTDVSHSMNRIEVVCGICGGHLGHVFDDGPKPTGKRYCINSISLDFKENKYGEILEFLDKKKSKPKNKQMVGKPIGLIKNMSKARIGTVILTIGVIISLFGIRHSETCVITAIIGLILFFVGLWMIFKEDKKAV